MSKEKAVHPKRDSIINFLALIFIFFTVGALFSTVSGALGDDDSTTNIFNIVASLTSVAISVIFVKKTTDTSKIVLFGTPTHYMKNGFIMCSMPWLIMELLIFATVIVFFIKFFRSKYIILH